MINDGNIQQVLDKLKKLGYKGVKHSKLASTYVLGIPTQGYGHAELNYNGVHFNVKLGNYVHPTQELADALSELNIAGQHAITMNLLLWELNGMKKEDVY